ncbi:MAG: serine hydrolase [Opitutaceae bacterium]|nr:serine hydrolase [Opitutaceae bacterium]
MLRSSLLFVSFLLVSCSPGDRSDAESELDSRIIRIENGLISSLQIKGQPQEYFNLDERLEELGIPGLSVAFSSNGEVEWAQAYGMADKSENKPMTTGSYLLAGSISKPVAAIRSLQLVEDEVFTLDEDVNHYLTSWQVPNNEFTTTENVTLRRILSHTAGLTVWGFPGYDKGDEVPSVVDVLDGKGNTDPVRVFRQPGEAWQYSGGGYTIMQLAIEDTEDLGFAQSMKENVLDRMRMPGSTYENPLPVALHGIAATGYRANGDEVEGKWPIYPEMAAAGLWTTPSELIQYGIEIQRILQSGQDGVLSYKTVSEMLDAESDTHGLGPSVQDHTFGHGGADEGFRAQLFAWKDQPYAVVVMVNSDNGKIIRELLLSVANEYGLPGIEPVVREIIELEQESLNKFVGQYELEQVGVFDISVDGNRLKLSGVVFDYTDWLYPQSDQVFFGSETGSLFTFDVQDGVPVGFESQGGRAVRLGDSFPAN